MVFSLQGALKGLRKEDDLNYSWTCPKQCGTIPHSKAKGNESSSL